MLFKNLNICCIIMTEEEKIHKVNHLLQYPGLTKGSLVRGFGFMCVGFGGFLLVCCEFFFFPENLFLITCSPQVGSTT